MSHIHTEPGQHDHTVSIYLFRTDFPSPKIVLHMHKKFRRLAQFGGHIELDETPWRALIRELEEETGYTARQVNLLQPKHPPLSISKGSVHPHPMAIYTIGSPAHYHTDSAFVMTTKEEPMKRPQEGESADIRLFDREELHTYQQSIDSLTYDLSLYTLEHILDVWRPVNPSSFN